MLASSGKAINLDLGSRKFDHDSKHSFGDEEISIPKNQNPDDIFSLKFVSFLSCLASRSPKMANGLFDRTNSNVDDVLTTPVLNTPKSTDVWSSRTEPDDDNFSPEMPSELEIGLREPPRDLPMDSDIGLRSPCDGVLAKRRKQMREMNKKAESLNADKVASDNPTNENSPKDLTTRPQRSMPDHQRGSSSGETSLLTGTRAQVPSSPRNLPGVLPSPFDVRCYEDFKRPASLQNSISNAMKENDLPAHINPSPLAVPSPNWSAVDLFFGVETIRTPKNLDNPIFEYFGAGPGTPRSATRFKDRSPNPTMDCYSGRDQRLSPRLSPRFPIPEAPTDLSGRPPPASELQALNEVQDLSTRSLKSQSVQSSPLESTSPSPPQTTQVVPPMAIKPTPPHSSLKSTNFLSQVKLEYPKRANMNISKIENSHSSEMSSSSLVQQQQGMNELSRGQDKGELSSTMASYGSDYAYCQPPPHHLIPQCSTTSYQNPFYNSSGPGYNHGYQRGMFNNHDMDQASPPRVSSPSRSIFERSRYQEWAAMINHPHTNAVHQNFQSQHLNMSHNTSGGSLMTDTHPWNSIVKEEPSTSPPPMVIDKFKSRLENKTKKATTANELENGRKKRVKNQSDDREEKRGRKKGEAKIKKEFCDGTASESKRQYVCQYCQRSYDWNYNLNRHQKYECGKENAFQCAKCGRKFPHKQNCVYHLKRKHKIVYETIDQYMTAGLVIFRGASEAAGHEDPSHSVM